MLAPQKAGPGRKAQLPPRRVEGARPDPPPEEARGCPLGRDTHHSLSAPISQGREAPTPEAHPRRSGREPSPPKRTGRPLSLSQDGPGCPRRVGPARGGGVPHLAARPPPPPGLVLPARWPPARWLTCGRAPGCFSPSPPLSPPPPPPPCSEAQGGGEGEGRGRKPPARPDAAPCRLRRRRGGRPVGCQARAAAGQPSSERAQAAKWDGLVSPFPSLWKRGDGNVWKERPGVAAPPLFARARGKAGPLQLGPPFYCSVINLDPNLTKVQISAQECVSVCVCIYVWVLAPLLL